MKVNNAQDLVVIEPDKKLRRTAKACEEEALKKLLPKIDHLSKLDDLLDDVYNCHRPKDADYSTRRDLIRVFNEIAKEIYGFSIESPVIEPYGSFVMDMFSAQSDLDLSINFKQSSYKLPREQKIKILKKFANKFRFLQQKGHVSGVESILTAKVPIVKLIDQGSKVECDFSVENQDGILKSQIIHIISDIDDRFQKLCVLMKLWAKAWGINCSRDRTLNSISIISLVAFHLQTRSPAILPPFSYLYKDGRDPANVRKRMEKKFTNWGKKNYESLGWLFVTLLIKLKSVEELWSKGLCASLYRGFWISKSWNRGIAPISIQDFSDQTQNFARAVGEVGLSQIYGSIQSSISYLNDFFNGKKSGSDLRECLFRDRVSMMSPSTSLRPTIPLHHGARRGYPVEDYNSSNGKRMRHDGIRSPAQQTAHTIPSVFNRNPALPISGNPPMSQPTLPAFPSNAYENSDRHLRKRSHVAEDEFDDSGGMPTSWYAEISSPSQPTAHYISSFSIGSPALQTSGNPPMPPSTLPAFRPNADGNSDRHLRKRSRVAEHEHDGLRGMPTSCHAGISSPRRPTGLFSTLVFSHDPARPFSRNATMPPPQTSRSYPNGNMDQHPRIHSHFAEDNGRERARYNEVSFSVHSPVFPISSTAPVASRYWMPPHQVPYESYHNEYRFPPAPFRR